MKPCFLRAFFNLLYHELAWMYDFVAAIVSLGDWKKWVMTILPDVTGAEILEIGHGTGYLQVTLRKMGFRVYGLDESASMVKIAAKNLIKAKLTPQVIHGYAQYIPYQQACFHHVIATFPTEYILDPLTVSETYRVLKPGGTLIILPIAWITGKSLFQRIAAWLFQITDQATPWVPSQLFPFLQAGFKLQHKVHEHRDWSTAIILARK